MENSALLGVILAALGAGDSLVQLWHFARLRRSRGWPRAAGVVVESGVAAEEESIGYGHTTTNYRPVVRYEYEVAGVRHTGERVRFGPLVKFHDRALAEAAADAYPQGAAVSVSHDPRQPEKAVLEQDASKVMWSRFWFGIVLAVAVAAVMLFTDFL